MSYLSIRIRRLTLFVKMLMELILFAHVEIGENVSVVTVTFTAKAS
jgi:hypothetical protein